MGDVHHPRRGSLQYWPRKRSKHKLVRVRSWAKESKAKPLGFIGYKAGMTHLQLVDNRPKSLTKGEKIVSPATILECPPLNVVGVSFYKKYLFGIKKNGSILAKNLPKELKRKIQFPKKETAGWDKFADFDDLRLLVQSNFIPSSLSTKKPRLIEISLGGNKDDKLAYAKESLGREIKVEDVFNSGNLVDVRGVSKGKGFQGTVKRYGVPIRQHKAEKTKRGIGNLGSWTPKRVEFSVAQPGKMGYHQRTEYNKQILKINSNGDSLNPKGGIVRYGLVNGPNLLVKGSVVGPKKRALLLTSSIRPNKKMFKEAPEITFVSQRG
ncbi:MAG TPA: 50S ribosomal protein L3 [Candidatus Nanoarchaeia archaeon]|nr:50S ribosomal protein L3 [Candidatus Nanoarchaeia archaeon]